MFRRFGIFIAGRLPASIRIFTLGENLFVKLQRRFHRAVHRKARLDGSSGRFPDSLCFLRLGK